MKIGVAFCILVGVSLAAECPEIVGCASYDEMTCACTACDTDNDYADVSGGEIICRKAIPGCSQYKIDTPALDMDDVTDDTSDGSGGDDFTYSCSVCANGYEYSSGSCVSCNMAECETFVENSCACTACTAQTVDVDPTDAVVCRTPISGCASYTYDSVGDAYSCTTCTEITVDVDPSDAVVCRTPIDNCDSYSYDSGSDSYTCTGCTSQTVDVDPSDAVVCRTPISGCASYTYDSGNDAYACTACTAQTADVDPSDAVVCRTPIDNCGSYSYESGSDSYTCKTCVNGFERSSGMYSCTYCNDNTCETFEENSCACAICNKNYDLSGGKCCPAVHGCGSYTDCVCDSCASGFTDVTSDEDSQLVCESIIPGCDDYELLTSEESSDSSEGGYVCKTCAIGFKKVGHSCEECTISGCETYDADSPNVCVCDTCSGELVPVNNGGQCCAKVDSCAVYGDECQCTKCMDDYKLVQDKCVLSCEEISKCVDYDTDCTCLECAEGYDASGHLCCPVQHGCSEYDDMCECSSCADGFVNVSEDGVSVVCRDEIEGCATYISIELDDSSGVDGKHAASNDFVQYECSACVSGYFLGSDTCEVCPNRFDECKAYDAACMCVSCVDETLVPVNGATKCCEEVVACDTYSDNCVCNVCQEGFTYATETNHCQKDTCENVCRAFAEDSCSCTKCLQGFYVDKKTSFCEECENKCATYEDSTCSCATCPDDLTRIYNQDLMMYVCMNASDIPEWCASIDSDGKCLFCSRGRTLVDGNCTALGSIACSNCEEDSCDDALGSCSECMDGFTLSTVKSGVRACIPNEIYAVDKDSVCLDAECTKCAPGYGADSGKCVLCENGAYSNGTAPCTVVEENSIFYGFTFRSSACSSFDSIIGGCALCKEGAYLTQGFTCEFCPNVTYMPASNHINLFCLDCELSFGCNECHSVEGICTGCDDVRFDFDLNEHICIEKITDNVRMITLIVLTAICGVCVVVGIAVGVSVLFKNIDPKRAERKMEEANNDELSFIARERSSSGSSIVRKPVVSQESDSEQSGSVSSSAVSSSEGSDTESGTSASSAASSSNETSTSPAESNDTKSESETSSSEDASESASESGSGSESGSASESSGSGSGSSSDASDSS